MKKNNRTRELLIIAMIAVTFLFVTDVAGQVTSSQEAKILKALPKQAIVKPKKKRRILVFSRTEGYRHDAIPFANKAFELMGKTTGAFETEFSEQMSIFEPESLKEFDAIILNNTTDLKFEDHTLRKSLLDFVKSGKGLMGIHAATDNFYDWPEAAEMMGAIFDGHPWDGQGTWTVEISDPNHVLNKGFKKKKFKVNDEIYRQKQLNLRENSRVLIGLDMKDSINLSAKGVTFTDKDIPISWVKKYGKGRIFYCSFGHTPAIYWNSEILAHYFAGIQFILGDLQAETEPIKFDINSVLNYDELAKNLAIISNYKFGQSRVAHKSVRQFVSLASQSNEAKNRTEKEFIKFLESNATVDGKQFVSHLLADIGSEKSVKILSKMLYDSSTVNMALFALEKIPNKSVDENLRMALLKSDKNGIPGILNVIGKRKDKESVPIIEKMVYSDNKQIASSAIAALGNISSQEAILILEEAKSKVIPEMRPDVVNALLICADALLEQNKNDEAYKIYNELFAPSEENQIRYAALRGIVHSGSPDDVDDLLVDVLLNENSELRSRVPMIVTGIPSDFDISGLIEALPSFDAVDQVRLLNAMSNRNDDNLLKMAITLAKNKNQSVRTDAFALIGKIGDSSVVQFLAEVASQKSKDGKAAQNALYSLAGEEVDSEIIKQIKNSSGEIKLQLIRSLRMRKPEDKESKISSILLQIARTDEPKFRIESIRALQFIAGNEDMNELIDLLVNVKSEKERSALEKTIVVTAHKNNGDSLSTKLLLSALSNSNDTKTRRSLLLVLAKVGHNSALPAFKKALVDSNESLKTAAIMALAEWSNDAPINELEKIIRESNNSTHRTLALRGFVRMINLSNNSTEEEKAERFRLAMELSETDNDKKMVLSGLAKEKTIFALKMASAQLNNPALRDEAEVAVVSISTYTLKTNPEETKKALLDIRKNSKNKDIIEQAQNNINEIEKYEDFITLWQISEVYSTDDDDDFYFEFPPEKGDENVKWTTMTEISDKNTPWQVNLTNIYKVNFCAGYLRTNIWSDVEQKVRLELGSNDGIKAWFNGELVHENDVSRTVSAGDDIVEVKLKKGWNKLMLKIRQLGGSWGACARIRNLDGSKIENLKYNPAIAE